MQDGTIGHGGRSAPADAHGAAADPVAALAVPGRASPHPPLVGTRKEELAAETLRLYGSDWTRFSQFCVGLGARALPATPETVSAFLLQPGPGRAARRRRLAAIDHRHRQHGFSGPGDDACFRAAPNSSRAAAPRRSRRKSFRL